MLKTILSLRTLCSSARICAVALVTIIQIFVREGHAGSPLTQDDEGFAIALQLPDPTRAAAAQ